MFNDLNSIIKKKVGKLAIILSLILIIMLAVFNTSFIKLVEGPVALYDLPEDKLKGAYVEEDIDFIIDSFAEYKETENNITKTTKKYYIMALDNIYIGLRVSKDDFTLVDKISDDTYNYLMGKSDDISSSSIHIKGTIKKMNKELNDYFYEWFDIAGFYDSEDELEANTLNYLIEPDVVGSFNIYIVYLALAICALLFLGLIVLIIKILTGAYLNKIKKFINDNPNTDGLNKIELDYQHAVNIDNVIIGKDYTFYFNGTKAMIVRNQEIIWAYFKQITHRTNGLKTHVSKFIVLNTRNRKALTIPMKNENNVNSALMEYSKSNPHIIIGFSSELEEMYKKDFHSLLNMSKEKEMNSSYTS